jgi:hypothetical protein
MLGQGCGHAVPSFSMPNPGLAPYTFGYNGQAYINPNGNYQALYTIIAYTDPISIPSSSLGFLPNHAYENTPCFNTYGQPKADSIGFETPLQFPFKPCLIDMTPARATAKTDVDPNNLTNQLATILHLSFGIEPKDRGCINQKPYPDYYDQLPYPRGYKVPEFSKLSREDDKTILEYVSQFILQCGKASANDTLKLRMFPLFLYVTAFTWFTSLAPNSIFTWAQIE